MVPLWAGFVLLVLALLALDLGVLHRRPRRESIRQAAAWSVFWISLGLAFAGVIYAVYEHHWLGASLVGAGAAGRPEGTEAVVQYVTGYLLEKSLSIDNLFVIALVFTSFRVSPEHQHRVLFWGIVGALFFRGAMIFGGVWLVRHFTWIFYLFGAYLIFAGAKILVVPGDGTHAAEHWSVRWARRILPVAAGPHDGRFVTRVDGRLAITELVVALLTIELTDVVFAVDSVPAVLAITTEPFVVVTSNVFAILGLRALYFVLAGMLASFRYLRVALAVLLAYIGAKMVLHDVVRIPNLLSLGIILGLVAAGVIASVLRRPAAGPGPEKTGPAS
jgi:tellurite resistance protein TerC